MAKGRGIYLRGESASDDASARLPGVTMAPRVVRRKLLQPVKNHIAGGSTDLTVRTEQRSKKAVKKDAAVMQHWRLKMRITRADRIRFL